MAKMPSYTRQRSKGGYSPVTSDYNRYDTSCSTPGKTYVDTWVTAQVGTLKTIKDCVTPHFEARVRRGEIIMNPCEIITETHQAVGEFSIVTCNAESCGTTHTHWKEEITGPYAYPGCRTAGQTQLPLPDLISSADMASLIAEAATKAWANASGHDSDLFQDIAEWHQTVGLASTPLRTAKKVLGIYRNARKAFQRRGAKRTYRAVKNAAADAGSLASELWLTYRFGVRPLVQDVNSMLQALELKPTKRRQTYRGKTHEKKTGSLSDTCQSWSTGCNFTETYMDEFSVHSGLLIEDVMTVQRYLGLDASGMLALPWELVPYSWAADYFANVGDFLYGLVPYLETDPLGSWYTSVREQSVTFAVTGSFNNSGSWGYIERAPWETRSAYRKTFTRVPNLPPPSLAVRRGSVQEISNIKSLNLLAVTLQQVARALKG